MTFAKQLQDTRAPEWEHAYIDYRALKVQLAVIRAKASQRTDMWHLLGHGGTDYAHHPTLDDKEKYEDLEGKPTSIMRWRTGNQPMPSIRLTLTGLPSHSTGSASDTLSPQTRTQPRPCRLPPGSSLKDSPLYTMLSNLPAAHVKFFDMLDAELEKVEIFYVEREEVMRERAKLLRRQLHELGNHRQLFHESLAHARTQSWAKRMYIIVSSALLPIGQWFSSHCRIRPDEFHRIKGRSNIPVPDSRRSRRRGFVDIEVQGPARKTPNDDNHRFHRKDGETKGTEKYIGSIPPPETVIDFARLLRKYRTSSSYLSSGKMPRALDPRGYASAKKRLRKAVIEHYRGLEVLNDYRTINLAGFRKVLKKYVKITKITILDAYMKEKVEPSVIASGAMAGAMMKETEHLFAARFERGNKKRAISHLRIESAPETRHSSTFRCGLWLGLAVPAIARGSYLSFQDQTHDSLPSWDVLLFIYSIFLLPILLTVLIGINIFVWERNRINYVFIFKLNPRSKLDYREYLELPSFLLCTLGVAFWLSLAQIGPPTLWPLVWLVLTLVVMFNPIRNFMSGQARWWTIRKIARLGASGTWTVEFADLWLGDQVCSLVYSFANLYFVGCFYTRPFVDSSSTVQSLIGKELSLNTSFPTDAAALYLAGSRVLYKTFGSSPYDPREPEAWITCGVSQNWTWYYLLGALPFLARFLQSMKQYWDSRLTAQLINAGKYGVGIIQYFFYFYWRHHMSSRTGKSYVLFCCAATINSLYGCAWDLAMDWSMCKPYARYPLLRPRLVYRSYIPLYYFSMLIDLCIRFAWLLYIFTDRGNIELYSFIAATLEVFRRMLWNFYRIESKHLINTELRRVVREPPLPYDLDEISNEEGGHVAQVRMRKRIVRLS